MNDMKTLTWVGDQATHVIRRDNRPRYLHSVLIALAMLTVIWIVPITTVITVGVPFFKATV